MSKPWSTPSTPKTPVPNGVHVSMYVAKNRLRSFDDHVSDDEDEEKPAEDKVAHRRARAKNILPVSIWLDTVINLFRMEQSWDLYYHLVEHFADQLLNKTF